MKKDKLKFKREKPETSKHFNQMDDKNFQHSRICSIDKKKSNLNPKKRKKSNG